MKFVTKIRHKIMKFSLLFNSETVNSPSSFQMTINIYQEQHFHVVLDEVEKHGLLLGRIKYMYENSNQIYIWTQGGIQAPHNIVRHIQYVRSPSM